MSAGVERGDTLFTFVRNISKAFEPPGSSLS